MIRAILLIFFLSFTLCGMSQTTSNDSLEAKLITQYNESVTQLEQLIEQKGLLEGYMSQKAEFLKSYGTIDSVMLANDPVLKKRIDDYKTIEANYKKVVESIPQLKGKMQALVEEINLIRERKK